MPCGTHIQVYLDNLRCNLVKKLAFILNKKHPASLRQRIPYIITTITQDVLYYTCAPSRGHSGNMQVPGANIIFSHFETLSWSKEEMIFLISGYDIFFINDRKKNQKKESQYKTEKNVKRQNKRKSIGNNEPTNKSKRW